ncbi:hypothetical protein B0A55_03539 [Friedmanniomyces simplex]|uniref:Rhodopsin domain-containing protein n=1 Tax=Friedmanniomyces simplex TaxID=329884 RepID=A0A4U0XJ72_9PEZI|nr:hypothetical protein B0A55_03539 [Friedmanniomyces simplex]
MAESLHSRFTPLVDDAYCNANNAPEILGVTGAFLGTALLSIALRFYVRIRMLKFVGAEDYIMLSAGLLGIGVYVCFIGETFYVFLVCFAISCLCTLFFDCSPVAADWDLELRAQPGTKCFSDSTYSFIGLFNSVINICTDVLFALLPIPIIVKLQINLRTKVTLAIILGLGFVACAAGIVKATLQVKFISNKDGYWHDSFNVFNMLELCLGIIAGSLPGLKPLFSKLLEDTRSALGRSNNSRKASRTPAVYPTFSGHTGGSVGKRAYDPRGFNEMLADVQLQDYSKDPSTTTVESMTPPYAAVNDQTFSTKKAKPYNVRITSGSLTREKSTVDEEVGFDRSESQERLHQPPGIYRTLEITRTSEPMRP